jgi:hypothetical protein
MRGLQQGSACLLAAQRRMMLDRRPWSLWQSHTIGEIGRYRLDLHADPAARDRSLVAQLSNHAFDRVGRNGKGYPHRTAGGREDRGIDADHVAVDVESRAAGIAFVDRRVDLDEIVIRAGADVAATRRDDTGGDGATETERIADRKNPVTNPRRAIRQLHKWEIAAVDFDEREIGARIGADNLGAMGLAVVGGDLNVFRIVHDVVIGHRVTVTRDEKAGPLAGDHLVTVRVRHAETPEETLERRSRREWQIVVAEIGPGRTARLGSKILEVAMRQREFLKGILGSCACQTVDLVRLTQILGAIRAVDGGAKG